uniref:Minor tail protein n=1 Tax=Siphoviridae sp. ctDXA22 TaxID=2826198 RepID=A0A8S5NR72_9CAUD|nr:MAG TPA: minor tail protein [Siphoviridae sp. ctDXA22]
MASTIKGITVKIAGDTIDLQKSLKAVQSSSSSLQSELSAVNRQLKFDPENTVLLAQKQEVLKEQIENSKSALDRLLEVQNQVEEQAKNGEISTEQYRAYQREVEKTKSKLNSFNEQLDKTRDEFDKVANGVENLENKSNKTDLSKVKKEMDEVKSSADNLKSAVGDALKEATATATAIGGAVTGAIVSANGEQKALNSLQAQAGLTAEEMAKYKDVLEDVYTGNFGESQEEVANVLALIKQTTNETNPSKLKDMTENLFTLRDAYDYDFVETLRAANMLMEQFGVTGDEAFNLIAQGSQKGLNKNGDLLDTINEYSVHYKQLGYDANEFFNSLENGSKAGTFSIDKLGDAMKEFGIRSKDTASSTQEGFTLLGYGAKASAEDIQKAKDEVAKLEKNLYYAKEEQKGFNNSTSELTKQKNADKIEQYSEALKTAKENLANLESAGKGAKGSIEDLQARFAKGGDSAKSATSEVLKALFEMDDKVKQNQAGVDLFGTMWEDLGIDGVKALTKVNGTADKAENTMKKIKDIKYDDVEADWESLGRTVQTDIINPIGKSLFPEVKKLCKFVENHTDDIIPTLKVVGSLVGGIWVGRKTTAVVSGVQSLIGAYKSLRTATETAKIAQEGLNLAQKSNAIGIIVGLAATLVGSLWSIASANDEAKESQDKLNEAHEQAQEEIKELKDANDEYVQSKKDAASEVESEFQYYDDLWVELQGIVDKNGEVKKGYEDRAKFITNELSRVTGNEITWNGNVIQSYKDLKSSMDDALESKKALALLSATEDSYQTAVSGLAGAKTDAINAYAKKKKAQEERDSAAETAQKYNTEGLDRNKKIIKIAGWAFENGKISQTDYQKYLKDAQNKQNTAKNERALSSFGAAYGAESQKAKDNLKEKEKTLKEVESKYNEYQRKLVNYNTTIQNVENLTAANAKGNTEEIRAAMSDLSNNIVTYTTGNKDALEQQVNDFKTNAENLRTAYKDGVEGVTKDQVEEAEELQERAEIELAKYNDMYGTVAAIATGKADEINAQQKKIKDGFIDAETGSRESLENQLANFTANYELLKTAMDENQPGVTQKMVDNAHELVDKATVELNKLEGNGETAGKNGTEGVSNGMKDEEALKKVDDSGKKVLNETEDSLSGSYGKGYQKGKEFTQGYIKGLSEGGPTGSLHAEMNRQARELAETGLISLANAQDSHSPSRKTRKLGRYFGEGYRLGIEDEIEDTQKMVRSLTSRALSAVEGDPIGAINGKFANIRTQSQNATVNGQMSKTVTNSPTIEIKFTGDVVINNDMDVDDFNRRVSAAIVETLDGEASKLGG